MSSVGQVAELWRYPVKSMGGQRLDEVRCDSRGVDGDRCWAVRGSDGKLGSGKTTRRFRRMKGLLSMASRLDSDGAVWIRFASGETSRIDDPRTADLVGDVVNEEVSLVEETATSHFDDAALHLLTASSLAWLARRRPDDGIDRRRFRPNIVIKTEGSDRTEHAWIGRTLAIGEVVVRVDTATERCVMTTMAQDGLGFAPGVLGELHAHTGSKLGVYGSVAVGSLIRLGDEVKLLG